MHALRIQAPQQTLSASAGQWGHHRGHSTTCLDSRPCSSTITWAPDRSFVDAPQAPILTPEAGSVAAPWTLMHQTLMPQPPLVSVSHSGAQRESQLQILLGGLGGGGKEIKRTSACATNKFNSPFAQSWQLKISAVFTNTNLS